MAHSIALRFVRSGEYRRTYSSKWLKLNSYQWQKQLQFPNCQSSIAVASTGSFYVSKCHTVIPVRHNTQHRVVVLPEIPPDNPSTNPLLKLFDEKPNVNASDVSTNLINLPDYRSITERHCYFGLGKALLEYESAVAELEQKCEDGVTDFNALFEPFERARCQFEGVWSSVNLLNLTTDSLDRDRSHILQSRAEAAFNSRFASKKIQATIKQIKADQLAGKVDLDKQQQMYIEKYLAEYRHNGFELPELKYRELTETWTKRLNDARRDYQWRMTQSTERFRHQIKDPNVVRDFPVDVLKAMAIDSTQPTKGPWTVTLHPYIYKQVMAYSPERSLRWKVHQADVTRGDRIIDMYTQCFGQVRDIRQHRLDVALTLGYKNFGEQSLATNKMAANVDNVHTMISSLLGKAKQYQEIELEQLQAYAESRGFDEELEVYDVEFLKRKQRRTLLGMSDEDFRDYLPLPKVLTGIFRLCEALFDLRFEEIGGPKDKGEELSKVLANKKWVPEIKLYQIIDVGPGGCNKVLGKFFLDPYIRDDKGYGGGDKGWYVPIRPHSSIAGCEALGAMVLSLPIPNYGKPSLLNISETEEILRNFGNLLLHVCSATNCKWADLSGRMGLEWDVLHMHGIFMTHWLYVPEVLRSLSGHWSTNEPLPSNAIETLCTLAGKQHMAGYSLCNELYQSAYDIAFYTEDYEKESYIDLAERLRGQYLLLPAVKGDVFPIYLSDMMCGDNPAALYSKTWAKMLAADAFSAVQEAIETNGMQSQNQEFDILKDEAVKNVTRRFRTTLLDKGSSQTATEMFRQFRGRDPSQEALLLSLGLQSTASPKIKGQKEAM